MRVKKLNELKVNSDCVIGNKFIIFCIEDLFI